MSEAEKDRLLLEQIRAGNKAACDDCVRRHADGIYRLALRLVRDPTEAEDVMQETFLNAFKSIDRFDGRSELRTWLYRIAYNAAMARFRRKHPELTSIDEPGGVDDGTPVPEAMFDWSALADKELERAELRAEMERAIQELPEKLRVVFVLRELEELSTEETAATLGSTIETVKTRLHRARLWLRERLTLYFEKAGARP